MSVSLRRPIREPTFDLGTVVILSTINRDMSRRPFRLLGWTSRRTKGASAGFVVRKQIVTDRVASKASS